MLESQLVVDTAEIFKVLGNPTRMRLLMSPQSQSKVQTRPHSRNFGGNRCVPPPLEGRGERVIGAALGRPLLRRCWSLEEVLNDYFVSSVTVTLKW